MDVQDPDARKDGKKNENGSAEDETVRQHHQHNGQEFEQTLGDSGEQRYLACCSLQGRKVRHDLVTEQQLILLPPYPPLPTLDCGVDFLKMSRSF